MTWDMLALVSTWILAAVAVIAFFGITVFVHELGHFVAARMCGMVVDTFSIGFGPSIWKRKVGNTVYKIGWFPFGGYVALPQLDPSGMETIQGANAPEEGAESSAAETPAEPVRNLPSAKWWQRILVSLAGPFGNIVLALLIALMLSALPPVGIAPGLGLGGAVIGYVEEASGAESAGLRLGDQVLKAGGSRVSTWDELITEGHLGSGGDVKSIDLVVSNRIDGAMRTLAVPLTQNETSKYYGIAGIDGVRLCGFGEVMADSPAAAAGVEPGDLAVAVDGVPLYGSALFVEALQASEGRPLNIQVLRKTQRVDLVVTPRFNEEDQRWQIGVRIGDVDPKVPMWMQYRRPLLQLKGDFMAVGRVLQALVAPRQKGEGRRVAAALSGPVVILTTMWMHTLSSLLVTIGFVRFLNVNLAIINLLPLPVLDGGHIVFALYEGITRRKVHPKVLNILVNGFAILLLILFVFITIRDTWILGRIFGGAREPAAEEQVQDEQVQDEQVQEDAEVWLETGTETLSSEASAEPTEP